MYNRYVPQGDGRFQRSTLPDPPPREIPRRPPPAPGPAAPPPAQDAKPTPQPPEPPMPPSSQTAGPETPCPGLDPQSGLSALLRGLLPRNMDSGDLLLLLILLLLLNDGSAEAPSALLTLGLYFLLKPEEGSWGT